MTVLDIKLEGELMDDVLLKMYFLYIFLCGMILAGQKLHCTNWSQDMRCHTHTHTHTQLKSRRAAGPH